MSARRDWGGLALLQLPLLAGWALYVAGPGKGESRALLVFAVAAALFSLGVVGVAALWPKLRAPSGEWRLPLWLRRTVVVGLIGAGFAVGLVARPEWIYALTLLNIAAAGVLAVRSLLPDEGKVVPRWGWTALAAGAAAVILLRVYGLAYYPYTQITDEGWLLGWAVGYLRTGQFSDYLMAFGGHDVHRYYLPMAWWLSAVGVGFWEARLFSYLVTLGVVVFGGLAGASLYDRATGWTAGLILFASAIVMIGARIRHDAGLALSIALCLWLFGLALRRKKLWLHALAGAMLGLGWFSHYHAIGFGPAIAVALYLPAYAAQVRAGTGVRRWLPPAAFWAFAGGGLLGAGIVFVAQVLPDWDAFLLTRDTRAPASLAALPGAIWGHIESIGFHSRYELILIGLGLGAALWRRGRIDLSLSLALVLCHFALGIMASVPWDHYPMALTPVYALLVAAMITRGLSRSGAAVRLTRRTVALGLCVALPALGGTLQIPAAKLAAGAPMRPPPPIAAQWILDHVPLDARIEGEHFYYLWLHDYRYLSPLSPNFMPPELRAQLPTLEAQWAAIAPDVILLDPNLNTCCILGPLASNGWMEDNGYRLAVELPGASQPIRIFVREGLIDDAE